MPWFLTRVISHVSSEITYDYIFFYSLQRLEFFHHNDAGLDCFVFYFLCGKKTFFICKTIRLSAMTDCIPGTGAKWRNSECQCAAESLTTLVLVKHTDVFSSCPWACDVMHKHMFMSMDSWPHAQTYVHFMSLDLWLHAQTHVDFISMDLWPHAQTHVHFMSIYI